MKPQLLTPEDIALLDSLRAKPHRKRQHPHPPLGKEDLGRGDVISDFVAKIVGSWRFIIIQTILLIAWIAFNAQGGAKTWDPYPFILLNLFLSFQAAYTAPVIMMSQNRQDRIDRKHAEDDYLINVKAELEIELLHHKIDLLREQEITRLQKLIEALALEGTEKTTNTPSA